MARGKHEAMAYRPMKHERLGASMAGRWISSTTVDGVPPLRDIIHWPDGGFASMAVESGTRAASA